MDGSRARNFGEASVKVRNVASKLDGAETGMEDQEPEQRQPVQETPAEEIRSTEEQEAGRGSSRVPSGRRTAGGAGTGGM